MAWTPSTTALGSTDENVNISFTPTYIDDSIDPITGLAGTTALPVTITATEAHPTITVGSSISGYYSDSFDYEITYKNINRQMVNTTKFSFIKIQAEMRFFVGYCYFFSSNFAIFQS